jgi:hypothetical protein
MPHLPTRTYEDCGILNTIVRVELKSVEGFSDIKYNNSSAWALLAIFMGWAGMGWDQVVF